MNPQSLAIQHMDNAASPHTSTARVHANYAPGASEAMMKSLRLEHPLESEYEAVHAIARDTIGGPLAPLEEIRRVDEMTGSAIWVVRRHGVVAGFLAPLALSEAGRNALIDGTFNAGAIERRWVARLGEPLDAFYCWSYAGRDQVTRGALVMALRRLIDGFFPELTFYGRDTTEAGARIMLHLGFLPHGTTPHLFWRCRNILGDGT